MESCRMSTLFDMPSSGKPTLEITVVDAAGRERAGTVVPFTLVVRNDTSLRQRKCTPCGRRWEREAATSPDCSRHHAVGLQQEAGALGVHGVIFRLGGLGALSWGSCFCSRSSAARILVVRRR